jgi:hypothetical protein
MCQGQYPQEKGVGEYNKVKPDNIFGYIGNAAAQAADHVHIADSVFTFPPSVPFFKKYEQKKGWHGDE